MGGRARGLTGVNRILPMKTNAGLLLLLPCLAFAAADRARPMNCPSGSECPANAVTAATPTTLPAADLVFAVEEERVAHDFYAAALARWNLPVFEHLAAAEARHAAALTQVAVASGIALPAARPGVYATGDLQRLHDSLAGIAAESETGALQAGALIEETDIVDVRRAAALATDAGTRAVLAQLEQASSRHLAALAGNLAARGITYQPRLLSGSDYAAVLAAAPGRHGGPGRGYRGGR